MSILYIFSAHPASALGATERRLPTKCRKKQCFARPVIRIQPAEPLANTGLLPGLVTTYDSAGGVGGVGAAAVSPAVAGGLGPYGGEGQKCHISGFANLLGFAKPNREFVIAGISRSYVSQKDHANLKTFAEAFATPCDHQKDRLRRSEVTGGLVESNFPLCRFSVRLSRTTLFLGEGIEVALLASSGIEA